jgi:hypothetical protein
MKICPTNKDGILFLKKNIKLLGKLFEGPRKKNSLLDGGVAV